MKLDLQIDPTDAAPIYLQIARSVRQRIAAGELAPGAALPTVRELAQRLDVNQNTVLRAYGVLRDEGLLEGRASLGTHVAASARSDAIRQARESELRLLASRFVSDSLSRGYSLPELEAAFIGQRARWSGSQGSIPPDAGSPARVLGLGSNDLCLELLIAHFHQAHPDQSISFASVGSLAGLLALARGEIHFAAAHLFDAPSGDYNAPLLRELAPRRSFALVTVAHRSQGILVPKGNPLGLRGVADLVRPGVHMVNRQRGSGTRVLLDQLLLSEGIAGETIAGYQREEQTHSGVAAVVAQGGADAGLGIRAAAVAFDLDFLPLASERYELALALGDPLAAKFAEILARADFRRAAEALGGYDLAESGTIRNVTPAAGGTLRS